MSISFFHGLNVLMEEQMYCSFYKPKNAWAGDIIPYFENGIFYLYYLRETRINGIPAEKTAWELVTTRDFSEFEEKGVVLQPGGDEEADRSCYTGSVVRGQDGTYHLFYTAQNSVNPGFMYEGRPLQYIAHASGNNLIHWQKNPDFLLRACGKCDIFDWRDPFVFYSEERGCYIMLLAARQQKSDVRRGGMIYYMTSENLEQWQEGGVFYAPEMYMTHECPDCFKMGDWWYLIFSTFSEKYVTHYRISRSLDGPWRIPANDTFDGRAFYAAKTVQGGDARYILGWVPTKAGETDYGKWEWAGNLAVHQLHQEEDGTLSVRPPQKRIQNFRRPVWLQPAGSIGTAEFNGTEARLDGREKLASIFFGTMPRHCCINARISFSGEIASYGIQLHADQSFDCGYFYRMEPLYQRVVFDQWPRSPLKEPIIPNDFENDRPFDAGLERPVVLKPDKSIKLTLLVDEGIYSLYIDDKAALTARCYQFERENWGFFAVGGWITVSALTCTV